MDVQVRFQHWRYVFPAAEMMRYGSPHFDRVTAGRMLSASATSGAEKIFEHVMEFDKAQLLSANEAFPEAALSDPLADLDVWDEWRSGVRAFPYPGRYSRLGIRRQEGKVSSTSSVGVIGEIMAGLYAQAGIAPSILVRGIRHWPDFILYLGADRFAFVEAKAYTRESDAGKLLLSVPERLLSDCLVDALQQLNADPSVQVWNAFTGVEQVRPLVLGVTFLELDAPPEKRDAQTVRALPQPVVTGLAERALERIVGQAPDRIRALLRKERRNKLDQREIEEHILPGVEQQVENLLAEECAEIAVTASQEGIRSKARDLLSTVVLPPRVISHEHDPPRFSRDDPGPETVLAIARVE